MPNPWKAYRRVGLPRGNRQVLNPEYLSPCKYFLVRPLVTIVEPTLPSAWTLVHAWNGGRRRLTWASKMPIGVVQPLVHRLLHPRMSLTFSKISFRWLSIVGVTFVALVACAHVLSPTLAQWLSADVVASSDRAAWEFGRIHSSSFVLAMMTYISVLHGTVGILLLTAAGAWAWRRWGRLDGCVRLLFAVPAGMLLNVLVKAAIHRVRPDWAVVELPRSYSFPSGHAAEATVFYGALALEATVQKMHKLGFALALGAVAMVAVVAASRIVLGVHFLSDCLGAVIEGVLWLAACFHRSPLQVNLRSGSLR